MHDAKFYRRLAPLTLCFAATTACSKDEDKKSETTNRSVSEAGTPGTISLAFDNTTTANLLGDLVTPSYFGLKVIAVELVDEANSRRVAVWVNSACKAEELAVGFEVDMTEAEIEAAREAIRVQEGLGPEATIDPGTKKSVFYPYYDAQNCNASDIGSFIDLARTSAEVNAEINSQGLPVPPDTYTQVSLRLCNPSTDTTTFKAQKLQASGMAAAVEVTGSGCGVTGAPTTSIVVEAGDTAKVKLAYDVSTFVEKTTWPSVATLPDPASNANCYLDEPALTYYCSKLGASSVIPSLVPAD